MILRVQPLVEFFESLVKIRGWPFLASWTHRVTGVLLFLYICLHIVTLSSLSEPGKFDAKMGILGLVPFVFLEFLLVLPVIYHALNGGRLILYEVFENRRDQMALKWVVVLGALYTLLLAFFMIVGNQVVSATIFWVYAATASACVAFITIKKLRASGASQFWKFQRISGAFLFLMVPAHMLFMHLNQAMGHDSQVIIARMGNPFIKMVDLALLAGVLYHGSYGLHSIGQDYITSLRAKAAMLVLLVCLALILAWIGLKLIVKI
jgi:succinate dehydrogenase / fumarate reductase cytochrome b subunit